MCVCAYSRSLHAVHTHADAEHAQAVQAALDAQAAAVKLNEAILAAQAREAAALESARSALLVLAQELARFSHTAERGSHAYNTQHTPAGG